MRISFLLFLSVFTFSLQLFSQNEGYNEVQDIEKLKSSLKTTSANTNTINSSFTQEKNLWMLEEIINSTGTFLFKKPSNILWQYHTPVRYSISIFNGSFTINNDGKVSKFDIKSNPLFQEINRMIVTAIRGDFIDNPDFTSSFTENTLFFKAKLIPVKDAVASMITSIDIYFSKSDLQVSKVVFHEPGEDFTSIVFRGTLINEEIDDSMFITGNSD